IVAFLCIKLIPGTTWAMYAVGVLYVLTCVFNASFWMAVHRAMLNFVKEDGRVSYTNLWTIGTSLALAITPVLVGFIVEWFGLLGFRACFFVSGVMGMACAVASRYAVPDGDPADRRVGPTLDPAQPFRTLGRILW